MVAGTGGVTDKKIAEHNSTIYCMYMVCVHVPFIRLSEIYISSGPSNTNRSVPYARAPGEYMYMYRQKCRVGNRLIPEVN